MDIGQRIRNLRIQKNLTQEELGERTDLTKGYISQLERNLSSPSMETFFSILEVLGCQPNDFFETPDKQQKVTYEKNEQTYFEDDTKGYQLAWLVPESNEKEMEPILLEIAPQGQFKHFAPSLAETFAYVIKGTVCLKLGSQKHYAQVGESLYFHATAAHQLFNESNETCQLLLVATDSYL